MASQPGSLLATRRGRLTLLLLCAVQFLDIADSSIMNVALPSIRRDLGFSTALGLAVFSAIATARTSALVAAHVPSASAGDAATMTAAAPRQPEPTPALTKGVI